MNPEERRRKKEEMTKKISSPQDHINTCTDPQQKVALTQTLEGLVKKKKKKHPLPSPPLEGAHSP